MPHASVSYVNKFFRYGPFVGGVYTVSTRVCAVCGVLQSPLSQEWELRE